jgi:uncharacterized membrane protein YphA (DoxX/SURF4 family)
MAIDRRAAGLTLLRILLGVFFLFEGLGKIRWLIDSSLLAQQLANWERSVSAGSISAIYIHRVASPFVSVFARVVPMAEIGTGVALIAGLWTPIVAFLAFVMVLNFHIASGAIFRYAFLTNGYGLPVLGGTLALAFGGGRLPWSLK